MYSEEWVKKACKEAIEQRDAVILDKCGVESAEALKGRLKRVQYYGHEEEEWILDGRVILRTWPPRVEKEYRGDSIAFCVIQDIEEV